MKIRVLHAYYGCDTGCCGHIIEIDGEEDSRSFTFDHFEKSEQVTVLDQIVTAVYGVETVLDPELRAFILKSVPDECHESIDWSSVEVVGDC